MALQASFLRSNYLRPLELFLRRDICSVQKQNVLLCGFPSTTAACEYYKYAWHFLALFCKVRTNMQLVVTVITLSKGQVTPFLKIKSDSKQRILSWVANILTSLLGWITRALMGSFQFNSNEFFTLLRRYAALMGSHRRFGTDYCFYLQGMGSIGCPETSVNNYQSRLKSRLFIRLAFKELVVIDT
jgi:hypothetical protein